MAITIQELRAIVSADATQYNATLSKVKTDTETAGKSIDSIFSGLGAGFLKAGAAMTAAFTAPLVAVSEMGREFETQLRRVAANTAMTDEELNKMREVVISIGRDSSAPLNDLAHGFEHAANFGFNAAESAKILDIAMQGAVTTGAKTEAVTNTLAGVLHIFGKSADEAAVTMNTLKEAAGKGNLTLEQFVSVSGRVFATAANLGLSLNEASGAMSALTRAGFPAAQASTQLVGALNHLVNPTKEIRGELERLSKATGVDLVADFSQAGLQSKGFAAILQDVKKAVGDNTAEALKLFGGLRGGLGVMALIGNASNDYKSILEKLSETMSGKLTPVQDAYAREVVTLTFQLGELQNRFTLLGAELNKSFGATQAGFIKGIADAVDAVTAGLAQADPQAKQLITTLLAGLAIGGPIVLGIGAIITLLGGPLTIAIVGVTAGLSVLFAESVAGAQDGTKEMFNFKDALLQTAQIFGVLLDAIGAVTNAIGILVKAVAFLMTPFAVILQMLVGDFKGAWETFNNAGLNALKSIGTSFDNMMLDINGRWSNTLTSMVQNGINASAGFGAAGTAAGNAFFGGIAQAAQRFPIKAFGLDAASQSIANGKIQWGKPSGLSDAEKQVIIKGIDAANAEIEAKTKRVVIPQFTPPPSSGKGSVKEALDNTLNLVNDWLGAIDSKLRLSDSVWKNLSTPIRAALEGTEAAFHKHQDTVQTWAATMQAATGISVSQVNAYLKSLGLNIEFTAEQLSKMSTLTGADAQKFFVGLGLSTQEADKMMQGFGDTVTHTSREAVTELFKQAAAWVAQTKAIEESNVALNLQFAAFGRLHPPVVAHIEDLHVVTKSEEDVEGATKKMLDAIGFAQPWVDAANAMTLNKIAADALKKTFEDLSDRLPKAWNTIIDSFTKAGSTTAIKVKGFALDIMNVFDTLPGKWGSAFNKTLNEVNKWVNFIDAAIKLIQKIVGDDQTGLGGIIGSIAGIFKKTTSVIADTVESAGEALGKSVGGVLARAGTDAASGAAQVGSTIGQTVTAGLSSFLAGPLGFVAALTAAIGLSISTFQSASKYKRFAGSFALGGVLGGLLAIIFGGPSERQKAEEAAAIQEAKDRIKLSVESVLQAVQVTLQSTIETFNRALEFFNNLDEFTAPRKAQFQAFWKAMTRLMNGFADLAKLWSTETLNQTKAVAETLAPVMSAISALPEAFTAINGHFGVAQASIDRFFVDFDKVMTAFFARSEIWIDGISKRAMKVADRLSPVVALISAFGTAVKDITNITEPADSLWGIFDRVIENIVTHVSALADKFDKAVLKVMANFADKAGSALTLWQAGVGTIKDIIDIHAPSEADFNTVFAGIEKIIVGMTALADRLSTDSLGKAEAIANASLAIFASIKAGVEALAALKDFGGVLPDVFGQFFDDFLAAIDVVAQMAARGATFATTAKTFEDYISTGSASLAHAFTMLSQIMNAAGAFFPGGAPSVTLGASSSTSLSAPSSVTSAPMSATSGATFVLHIKGDDPRTRSVVEAFERLFGADKLQGTSSQFA